MSDDDKNCPVLQKGDLMRISVEMIREIREQVGHVSPIVRVCEIVTEQDGSKIVYVEAVRS